MKNIQLENLELISSTQSILKKLIFIYEKDASVEPIAITTDELINRIVTGKVAGDSGAPGQTWIGLQDLTTKVNEFTNWKDNQAVSEILEQIANKSEDFKQVLRRLTVLEREILGETGETPYKGLISKVGDLQNDLANYSKNLEKWITDYNNFKKDHEQTLTRVSTLETNQNTLTEKVNSQDSALDDICWQTM